MKGGKGGHFADEEDFQGDFKGGQPKGKEKEQGQERPRLHKKAKQREAAKVLENGRPEALRSQAWCGTPGGGLALRTRRH